MNIDRPSEAAAEAAECERTASRLRRRRRRARGRSGAESRQRGRRPQRRADTSQLLGEALSTAAGGAGNTAPDRTAEEAPGVFAEWSGAAGGLSTEVELRLHPSQHPHRQPAPPGAASTPATPDTPATPATSDSDPHYNLTSSDTAGGSVGGGAGVVVRAEEALIVAFVLLLWVAAIALFFNRWGKIRMLEPYQPKFQQQHRASCPADAAAASALPPPPPLSAHAHRASLSRGCGSCGDYTLMLGGGSGALFQQCAGYSYQAPYLHLAHRPRQNSVFVGSTGAMALIPESPARRSRSAADLRALLQPPRVRTTPARTLTVTDV